MSKVRKNLSVFPEQAPEHFSIGWTHPIERKTLRINGLEHVLINENSDISEF